MKYLLFISLLASLNISSQIIPSSRLENYILKFNADDPELYKNYIPNEKALDFLKTNAPLFECPDTSIEKIYYFRWWTFRKHIRKTPEGFVITEFLPDVPWAGKYNTISCPAGFHIYEGRWLRNPAFIESYCYFWLSPGAEPKKYSFWAADAMHQFYKVHPIDTFLTKVWPGLEANFLAWNKSNLGSNGLYWQIDDRDGMEFSIGGKGGRDFPCLRDRSCKNLFEEFYVKDRAFSRQYRPTINSYMFADAQALSFFAAKLSQSTKSSNYHDQAENIRKNTMKKLWDKKASFFEVLQNDTTKGFVNVKEAVGYVPWFFNLPGKGYESAWKFVMDTNTFLAPYGLTTADRKDPSFMYPIEHSCQWSGYVWPFATSQTLKGMANLLQNYSQNVVNVNNYIQLLHLYAASHFLITKDKKRVEWIDESQHPFTGDWFTRTELIKSGDTRERGKDYNHSSYVDLVITGICGIVPQDDNRLSIKPLIPKTWDYLCLENVKYKNKDVSIVWDKTGSKYKKGKGFMVFVNGKMRAKSDTISNLIIDL